MKVCIMQPYFVPYPGYFLLYKYTDIFVILDDVQFNRRGYVHRNKFKFNNHITWLTLPLKKKNRNTLINELEFDLESEQMLKFREKIELITNNKLIHNFKNDLLNFEIKPLDYITKINKRITDDLGISKKTILSSSTPTLNLQGEEKIIKICKYLNADEYINLPGGKQLYTENNFKKNKIKINFLKIFSGEKISILNYYQNNKDKLKILQSNQST